ncbi:interleukin-20 receptor subunit alpha, partial [Aplochiton taeniatus]
MTQRSAILFVLWLLTHFKTAASSLSPAHPRPVDVFFSSVNLRNILQWHAGKGTPSSTRYTVQYAIYGDRVPGGGGRVRWRGTPRCRDTVLTWCDLSNETADLEEGYFARVKALGKPGGQRASSNWT